MFPGRDLATYKSISNDGAFNLAFGISWEDLYAFPSVQNETFSESNDHEFKYAFLHCGLSVCLSVCLLFVCLSVHLFVCSFVCLFVRALVHLLV